MRRVVAVCELTIAQWAAWEAASRHLWNSDTDSRAVEGGMGGMPMGGGMGGSASSLRRCDADLPSADDVIARLLKPAFVFSLASPCGMCMVDRKELYTASQTCFATACAMSAP